MHRWLKIIVVVLMFLSSITPHRAQYNKDYFLWLSRQMLIEQGYSEAISTLNTLLRVDKRAYEGYFLRGIAKYNLGDLIGAERDFSEAIELNPVYTTAYTYRAITRSRLGNYDDALQDFAEAISLRPDLPEPYYSRGVTRLLSQQFGKAIEDFNHFLVREKKVADAYINRGICHLQLKDTLRALDDFNTAIRTNRNSPEGYNRRGSILLEQEKYAEAESDFSRAIESDTTHIPSLFNRAIARQNQYRPEEALKDFDNILRLDSTSSLTYFNRAIILSKIGDYNNALEDYNAVAKLSPDNVLVYFYRANLLNRLGEIERAEKDYTRAIELYPDFANAYLSRANTRYLLRDTKGAMSDEQIAERKISEHKSKLQDSTYSIYSDTTYRFDRLLSFDTKLEGSSFEQSSVSSLARSSNDLKLTALYKFTLIENDSTEFAHREYYDEKLERFITSMNSPKLTIDHRATNLSNESLSKLEQSLDSLNLRRDNWHDAFMLGVTQSLISQYTSSIESLTKAIATEPNNPFLYINRAVTRAEMIEFISSIESSFQRITIDADPANKLNNSNRRNYDYEEAIRDMQTAIDLHPHLAYSHYNLAGLYAISARLPEAYEAYTEAIRLYPNFAQAYFNRAIVQIRLKDTDKGCIDLSKAGELGIKQAYEILEKYVDM